MTVLAAFLAALIGLTLGMLGGGGSILTVPVFVYALGIDPKRAIAMSLPVVGATALVGAIQHWRKGNVALRTAIPFGLAAMVGAFVGAKLSVSLNGQVQFAILSMVMIAAALSMLRSAGVGDATTTRDPKWPIMLAIGVAVGSVTGLVGAGGGFLIVPALVVIGGLPMSKAVGTSLLVIAMNTTSGMLGYHGTVDFDWVLIAEFVGIAAIGIVAGTALVPHLPQRALKRAFAGLLLLIGSMILYQYLTI